MSDGNVILFTSIMLNKLITKYVMNYSGVFSLSTQFNLIIIILQLYDLAFGGARASAAVELTHAIP